MRIRHTEMGIKTAAKFSKKNLHIIKYALHLQSFLGACGVIGSRARLRIWCREAWGFESLHAHNNK